MTADLRRVSANCADCGQEFKARPPAPPRCVTCHKAWRASQPPARPRELIVPGSGWQHRDGSTWPRHKSKRRAQRSRRTP